MLQKWEHGIHYEIQSREVDESYKHERIVVPEFHTGKALVRYTGTLTKHLSSPTSGAHLAYVDSSIFIPAEICKPLVEANVFRVSERYELDADCQDGRRIWIATRIALPSTSSVVQNQVPDKRISSPTPSQTQMIPEQSFVAQNVVRQTSERGSVPTTTWENLVIQAYLDRSRPFNFTMPS